MTGYVILWKWKAGNAIMGPEPPKGGNHDEEGANTMKKWKKSLAALLSAAMLLGLLAACDSGEKPSGASGAPDATPTPAAADGEYPITPEELGSGEAKWSEEKTPDGWMKVTNQGGATLGYSPDSGVKLIQVDGLAFKDLNRNGKLDLYEDWRQGDSARAVDLAGQLNIESLAGLMYHHSIYSIEPDGSDAYYNDGTSFAELMKSGVRTVLNFTTGKVDGKTQASWNNTAQAQAEADDWGIPLNITSNPINRNSDAFIDNLALAATFDTELVGKMYRAMSDVYDAIGVSTLLGPQIDVSSEPRWSRIASTFGEDPALAADMSNVAVSALQSTYAEDGSDLGWGTDSVVAMMKHFPGDGPGEGGREGHSATGKYNIYPGDAFKTSLIPFLDGALNLTSTTKTAGATMMSYSIAYSEDEEYGELAGSAFSKYKMDILREQCDYDQLICTDWGTTNDLDSWRVNTPWGYEDEKYSNADRAYYSIVAGIDQFGGVGTGNAEFLVEAYQLLVDDIGEEDATARYQKSGYRILLTFIEANLFEDPYCSVSDAKVAFSNEETVALASEVQQKSIVMLKNSDNTIKAAESGEKPTVYIPMQFSDGAWSLPILQSDAEAFYNVVTDTVGEPTGEVDKDGNATYTANDIVRATALELAGCDYALVVVKNPQNDGVGYDAAEGKYIPISLQYGDYTADSAGVRIESIAGDMVETEVENEYGTVKVMSKENRSYYGESAKITNKSDLESILYAVNNMPETAKIIVSVDADRPMVFSEFEDKVDAILVGFGVDNAAFLQVASGQMEPSGLLPLQMPKDMAAAEAQLEDVPRDMECYVDANGNTYDFGFGLNWSGVIQDERTAKYCVPALTAPETVSID